MHLPFASEAVPKKVGMNTKALFHGSSESYHKHRKSYSTGRLRVEESACINSVAEEESYLLQDNDDILNQVIGIIEGKGKQHIRLIPFDKSWFAFWKAVKKHFFIFENRKTAITYFYNDETCQFIGPLYDSGPRFKKEDCVKRYSLF